VLQAFKDQAKKGGKQRETDLAAASGCRVVYALYDPGTSSGRAFNSARHEDVLTSQTKCARRVGTPLLADSMPPDAQVVNSLRIVAYRHINGGLSEILANDVEEFCDYLEQH
jgi:hypothetical protein